MSHIPLESAGVSSLNSHERFSALDADENRHQHLYLCSKGQRLDAPPPSAQSPAGVQGNFSENAATFSNGAIKAHITSFYKQNYQLKDKFLAELNVFNRLFWLVLYRLCFNCETLSGLKGRQIRVGVKSGDVLGASDSWIQAGVEKPGWGWRGWDEQADKHLSLIQTISPCLLQEAGSAVSKSPGGCIHVAPPTPLIQSSVLPPPFLCLR